jgi:predicted Zn-dependent protease
VFPTVLARFKAVAPAVDFWSLRLVRERSESITVRKDILQPIRRCVDEGVMVTVVHQGGLGYAGTCDLSAAGLKRAVDEAVAWAERTRGRMVEGLEDLRMPNPTGRYETPVGQSWDDVPLADKLDLLNRQSRSLKIDDRITSWEAGLWCTDTHSLYLTSGGGEVEQHLRHLIPDVSVTANRGTETQTRTYAGRGLCRQGGFELLDEVGYSEIGPRLASEAIQLLEAPDCPAGEMDVVLAPDQMILQIHESVGHPLELDRILGDERNYAGTSFVTLDMFGSYRYGSELMNITYDPSDPREFATFAFDDDGVRAEPAHIIRDGILMRPLGSVISQTRAGVEGVANSRAASWSRAPIDRMANLNLEPGESSFDDLVGSVERGIYMKTNNSWSIDDSRNKFQFGCEWAQLIEDGELSTVVKNPNYRGISATFWRNLAAVGERATGDLLGTPWCGKGEPNQVIRVGHASPTCRFRNVAVFGSEG